MIMDHIIEQLQKLFDNRFVAVEIGTWNEKDHFIHILARLSSLYQVMEITRITGDPNPLICGGYDDKIKIVANVKRKI
jgi:hypothetical protein